MNNKILSIVEARVTKDNWNRLRKKYEGVRRESLPASVLSSYLVQDTNQPEIWRIVTIWENLEAMSAYRKSVETPAWIMVFQSVDTEPELTVTTIEGSK